MLKFSIPILRLLENCLKGKWYEKVTTSRVELRLKFNPMQPEINFRFKYKVLKNILCFFLTSACEGKQKGPP